MKISVIDQAIKKCEEHIKNSHASGTEIESMLTRAILVLACSAFEEEIKKMIEKRADVLNDPVISKFLKSCVSAVFRSTKSNELAGLLNRFGPQFKERFQLRTKGHDREVTFYNNIVTNRHSVAHTQNVNMTFSELQKAYNEGHVILDWLQDTLNETYSNS